MNRRLAAVAFVVLAALELTLVALDRLAAAQPDVTDLPYAEYDESGRLPEIPTYVPADWVEWFLRADGSAS